MGLAALLLQGALVLPQLAAAFYLPGVAPTSYREGQQVPVFVDRLTPSPSYDDEQVHSVLSFDYYTEAFHFCKPGTIESQSESLGSVLFGDRIQSSPFEFRMKQDEECKTFRSCGPQEFSAVDAEFVNLRIMQNFIVNLLVDGLPAGELVTDTTTGDSFYNPGASLGFVHEETPVLNNHFDFLIDYHEAAPGEFRVVGVEVVPWTDRDAKDLGDGRGECVSPETSMPLELSDNSETPGVVFTYSVRWQESPTQFATRWDKYLHVYDPKIHWFSLINSTIIVVFLSGMVFVILVRTLRKDITRYNKLDAFVLEDLSNGRNDGDFDDTVQEDSGWKLVHGDVFRPPKRPLILAILVGNGAQLFMMTGFTIAFALLGFLSPSNRGGLGTVMVLLYTLFGGIGGFVASYTYKSLGGSDRWREVMALTPTALPALVFGTFFLLDLFLWAKGSSGAVPFTTMLVIIGIWFLISVPLSVAGSWLGFKRKGIEAPVRTNQIPRQIPEASVVGDSSLLLRLMARPVPAMLITGVPPFVAMFFELYFIMASLWSAKVYYMFGFLFVCFGLMVVTVATVTVLAVYFQLCAENYHWQWRSFAVGGACAIYVFLNALVFWARRLSFGSLTSAVLYLGYSTLIGLLVFVMTGTVGFVSSYVFVHRIYRSIKVD